MSLAGWFLLIPLVCYLGASAVYAWHGQWPLALTYFCYAGANCGLIALDMQGGKL